MDQKQRLGKLKKEITRIYYRFGTGSNIKR